MANLNQTSLQRYRRYYSNLSNLSVQPKTKMYSTAVFSFLAISLFGLYAVLPTIRTILFLKREIVDKTKVNQQMEDKIGTLIESQAAYEESGDRLILISDAIPKTAQPVELALTLRNLSQTVVASTSSIQVSSVPLVGGEATTSATAHSGLISFPITIVTNGSFSSLKAFIDGLLSLKRIVAVDSMRFTPSAETGLQLVLQLKTYYQNQ